MFIVEVGGNNSGWLQLTETLSASAAVAEATECFAAFGDGSFLFDFGTFLSRMLDT